MSEVHVLVVGGVEEAGQVGMAGCTGCKSLSLSGAESPCRTVCICLSCQG